MRSWLRKELGWFVLTVTVLSITGPASKACACARMSADASMSQVTRGEKRQCSRCTSVTSQARTQVSRSSCCKSKVSDANAATAPAKLQFERHETRTAMPSVMAPPAATRGIRNRSVRAPPSGGARDSAAPPASYLSDYLRL